jgi:hypothetical protein
MYSGGQSRNGLIWLRYSVGFLSPSRWILAWYFQRGNTSQFTQREHPLLAFDINEHAVDTALLHDLLSFHDPFLICVRCFNKSLLVISQCQWKSMLPKFHVSTELFSREQTWISLKNMEIPQHTVTMPCAAIHKRSKFIKCRTYSLDAGNRPMAYNHKEEKVFFKHN